MFRTNDGSRDVDMENLTWIKKSGELQESPLGKPPGGPDPCQIITFDSSRPVNLVSSSKITIILPPWAGRKKRECAPDSFCIGGPGMTVTMSLDYANPRCTVIFLISLSFSGFFSKNTLPHPPMNHFLLLCVSQCSVLVGAKNNGKNKQSQSLFRSRLHTAKFPWPHAPQFHKMWS